MKSKYLASIVLIFCVLSWTIDSYSHSGRTDASGGHYNRKTGDYHYHGKAPVTPPTPSTPQVNQRTPTTRGDTEIYIWVDDRGVSHASDRPPENKAKSIGKDSPEEIRQYQIQQRENVYRKKKR